MKEIFRVFGFDRLQKHDYPIKDKMKVRGVKIAIENPKGTKRHWHDDKRGVSGSVVMTHPYGYIKHTEGADGDEVDVFVGPNKKSKKVFIINQRRSDDNRKFDEHKVFLGFDTEAEVRSSYLKHYDEIGPQILGSLRVWTMKRFKKWLKEGDVKDEPVRKSGGPFIGPRGGKWADPQHTIPWHESSSWGHSKAGEIHDAIRKVKHLSDEEAAEHIALVHDVLPTRAANEVARVRYGLTREQHEEAKAAGKLPERLDKPKPKEEPKQVTIEDVKPEKAEVVTPREEAKKELAPSDFINDRASKIEQRGEDVFGSARQRAAEWKGLREALGSDQAKEMFTKDFLGRQEPIDLISRAQRYHDEPLKLTAVTYLHYVANKFPGKPDIPDIIDNSSVASYYQDDRYVTTYRYGSDFRSGYDAPTKDEHEKKQREQYYLAWKKLKTVIESEADAADLPKRMSDPFDMNKKTYNAVRSAYEEFASKYGQRSAGTRALGDVLESIRKYRQKTSPLQQMENVARKLREVYPDIDVGLKKLGEHTAKILEGKSLNAVFGTKGEKKGYTVELSDMYDTSVMRRKGPPSAFKSTKQGLDMLDKSAGGPFEMRGVQWGKSVTDDEREHHLKSLVDSFNDLTDILGLPPQMASFNGKLAIAVGARGKAGTLAHYEPSHQVINLTRSGGAGSLAHEWGHFFDHILHTVSKEPTQSAKGYKTRAVDKEGAYAHSFASANLTGSYGGLYNRPGQKPVPEKPVLKEMRQLSSSKGWSDFATRVRKVAHDRKMPEAESKYWQGTVELFARAFERHVQRKLHKEGRENTYLVAVKKAASDPDGLWPTNEEVDAMAPHFDQLFKSFSESDLLKKALRYLVFK